jgi:hypothetical protein
MLIIRMIRPLIRRKYESVEVKSEAEKNWVQKLQSALKERVWTDNCNTVSVYIDCLFPLKDLLLIHSPCTVLRQPEDRLEFRHVSLLFIPSLVGESLSKDGPLEI